MLKKNGLCSHTKNHHTEFYEERYIKGYLEEWPLEKIQRIGEVIHDVRIPPKGEAIDFGCGNGILTEFLRKALPGWTIYGTDISKTAITNAKSWFPNCIFFELDDSAFENKKFDFLFTHHVIEHATSLQETIDRTDIYLKRKSYVLHFLPCGNEGSFEQNVYYCAKTELMRSLKIVFSLKRKMGMCDD